MCLIVLHAAEDALRERVSNLEEGASRDIGISMRINHASVRDARPHELVLDTGTLSPAGVMGAILRITSGPAITGEQRGATEWSCATVRSATSRLRAP